MQNFRKIQFYPSIEKPYSLDKTIIDFPPEGYAFIGTKPAALYNLADKATHRKWLRTIVRPLYHAFLKVFKTTAIFELTKKTPILPEADLVFSGSVIYDSPKPWILYMFDHPTSLAGNNYSLLMKNRDRIEKALLSPNCRKIIYTNQTPIDFMNKIFCREVCDKIILIDSGMKPIGQPKDYKKRNSKIKLLFMGSINNPQDFYIKGGLEVVKTFRKLSKRKDVEFVIRCRIPEELRKEITSIPNLTLIDKEISFEEIINLYTTSDLLFMPGHNYSVTAFIEAMSVGLPVLALNTYAVKDYIQEGHNGFIVQRSDKVKGYNNPEYPPYIRTDAFMNEIKNLDDLELIDRLVKKVEFLIENPKILEKMGKNARKEFLQRYDIEKRNREFKRVFDEAISN